MAPRIDSTDNAPANAQSPTKQLTADAIKKMTEKLSEMMGGEDITKDFGQLKNEKGELVNEEGLPIFDITEPLTDESLQNPEPAYFHDGDDYLPTLSTLPNSVQNRLRQERETILDQLEAEERRGAARDHEAEAEIKREVLEKRKQEFSNENEKLKAARELQKKMGRALLQNFAKERAEEQRQEAEQLKADEEQSRRNRKISTGPKKTVAFANIPVSPERESDRPAMPKSPPPHPSSSQDRPKGDVAFARLRPGRAGAQSLASPMGNQPMRMTVVERFPTIQAAQAPPQPTIITTTGDSDDESEPGEPDVDTEDELPSEQKIDEQQSDSDSASHMSLEEEVIDLDFAQHQREIALAYHEKRNKIGQAALDAMKSHTHDPEEDLPSDVQLPGQDKPPLSKFKASRLASLYGASAVPPQTSTSLGAAVVPEFAAKTIRNSIRTGKLDDEERLVGGDDDSADEYENEGLQEVLELLKMGQVYTSGPDGKEFHAVPPSQPLAESKNASPTPFPDLPPIERPRTSKFKLSRTAAGRPSSDTLPPPKQGPQSTSTVLERPTGTSSQKVPVASSQSSNPTIKQTVSERPSSSTPGTKATPPQPMISSSNIVDFPPSPPLGGEGGSTTQQLNPFSMIVDSPSFPNPTASTSQFSRAPQADSSRPSRPPVVMVSSIKESTPGRSSAEPQRDGTAPKKASRFMAERGL